MKRLFLLSFLILFSCSKGSEEENTIAPGDEIIGNHLIVNKGIPNSTETSYFQNFPIVENSSYINFTENKKGEFSVTYRTPNNGDNTENFVFDWTFDGSRWQLNFFSKGGSLSNEEITFFDGYYNMIFKYGQIWFK
tara:strand:- start:206 stop:613 length:408 start_codon:yes stop_codon:yes gene_type:complete